MEERDAGVPIASNCAAPSSDGYSWIESLDRVATPTFLALIAMRMSESLRSRMTVEDIWQETLLQAWKSRASFVWRGQRSFRRWLLEIASNRIRDAADRESAACRRGGVELAALLTPGSAPSRESGELEFPFGGSTTPSRVASLRERSEAMAAALEDLPEELRSVVRLRLFEDLSMDEVASSLGIGLSAAKHRFRLGSEAYRRRLRVHLKQHGISAFEENP